MKNGKAMQVIQPEHKYQLLYTQPLKMELTQVSETSANYNLTPGKYPKEHTQYSNHGESLKSNTSYCNVLRWVHICLKNSCTLKKSHMRGNYLHNTRKYQVNFKLSITAPLFTLQMSQFHSRFPCISHSISLSTAITWGGM